VTAAIWYQLFLGSEGIRRREEMKAGVMSIEDVIFRGSDDWIQMKCWTDESSPGSLFSA